MSDLAVRDLSVGYHKVNVVRGVSLDAPEGTIATVIGPNGAGKTTLLMALIGLVPSRGTVLYGGRDISDDSTEERVRYGPRWGFGGGGA